MKYSYSVDFFFRLSFLTSYSAFKGTSQTFQVLNNLVAKGVKVDLGIPQELWDEPPAEVTNLKTQCEKMLESHESDIEEW